MACNAAKTSFVRNVVARSYSAQAKPAAVCGSNSIEFKSTTTNGIAVVSAENCSPIARVSVVVKAGSRYETAENLGAAHYLRHSAGLGTKCATSFGIVNNIAQWGANLSATADRESIAYTLEGTRDAVTALLPYLSDVVSKQAFKPWEIEDSLPRLKYELAGIPSAVRAVDLLHKAAFRTSLGNSVYVPDHKVGKISSETLQHYVASNFSANRTAVVGLGIDEGVLSSFVTTLTLEAGAGTDTPAKYQGGDMRLDKSGPLAYVAVGTAGAALSDTKEALAFAVLQNCLGTGPKVVHGVEARSPLYKAVSNVVGSKPFGVTALNASYSDAGLFGFIITVPADLAGKAVESAVKVLKCSVSAEDVNRGKAQLRTAILTKLESGSALVDEIGQQALLLGQVQSVPQLVNAIETVSASDVSAAAKKVSCGKLSLAAVGNLATVPYSDQL